MKQVYECLAKTHGEAMLAAKLDVHNEASVLATKPRSRQS